MCKGGKFLKKLWCCVCGRVQQDNLVLSTELIRSFKADVSSVRPSSECGMANAGNVSFEALKKPLTVAI